MPDFDTITPRRFRRPVLGCLGLSIFGIGVIGGFVFVWSVGSDSQEFQDYFPYFIAAYAVGIALFFAGKPEKYSPVPKRRTKHDPFAGSRTEAGSAVRSFETPHCYLCAKHGHFRAIELVQGGVFIDMRKWNKPWSPTQSCFECGTCGRLVCYTHSDNRVPCDCGSQDWRTRSYLQKELDNG